VAPDAEVIYVNSIERWQEKETMEATLMMMCKETPQALTIKHLTAISTTPIARQIPFSNAIMQREGAPHKDPSQDAAYPDLGQGMSRVARTG
jgi:hypothetical protein